ncbi:MAG: hypothetical protein IT158_14865 [Bryobacterales bacterium]|nr:hypothetical protein [Bryobacterales bacterium]
MNPQQDSDWRSRLHFGLDLLRLAAALQQPPVREPALAAELARLIDRPAPRP